MKERGIGRKLPTLALLALAEFACVPIGTVPPNGNVRTSANSRSLAPRTAPDEQNRPGAAVPANANRSSLATRPLPPETPWPVFPFLGFNFGLGGGWGGDNILKATFSDGSTETLSAGGGLFLEMGATYTPVWFGWRLGLQFGTDFNLMTSRVGAANGKIDLTRYGYLVSSHLLLHVAEGWFLVAGGGLQSVFSAKLSGSALGEDIHADLGSARGAMLEFGLDGLIGSAEKVATQNMFGGARLTVRYARLSYSYDDSPVDGNYVAIILGIHFDPWVKRRDPSSAPHEASPEELSPEDEPLTP
jgi:hypothetical protein